MESSTLKKKWWVPRDNNKKQLFEKTKKDINHFLAVSQEGVPFSSFAFQCHFLQKDWFLRKGTSIGSEVPIYVTSYNSDERFYLPIRDEFEEVTGSPVPFRDLGFKTVGELLFHMDDVVNVRQDNRHGTLFLYVGAWAPIDDEIVHIRQLVIAQGISDKTKSMSSKGRKGLRLNTHDVSIEILLIAEKEKYTSGNFSHQPQHSFQRVQGNYSKRPQNPNRFAPWRDDRVRAVSEAGEPIHDESTSFSMSIPSVKSDLSNVNQIQSDQGPGPSKMPSSSSFLPSLPQYHFQAL